MGDRPHGAQDRAGAAHPEVYLQLRREQHRRREAARVARESEAIREKCLGLHGFIEEFWYVLEPARRFVSGWAIRAMCDHLEGVTAGEFRRLLETVPPGMMKSLMLVFWTAWEWGPKNMAHIQVLATSYSQDNVHRDNMKLRDLVVSEKYQALWPLGLRADQNSKSKFINERGGLSWARPFGSMTGGRGDRVKIDDPHSTKTAESDQQRREAVKILREQITDRLNDVQVSAIVMIMQRLHEQDAAAAAIEMGNYVHLNLPMRFEPENRCVTPIFADRRTLDGELLFPERFPEAEMVQMERDKGSYAWAGQYQQRPAPRDGGQFKRAWFEIVDAIPSTCGQRVRAWDFAATDGAGDYTVGLRMTRDYNTGAFYVEGLVRDRLSPAKVQALVKNTASQDGLEVRIRIPQDPAQAGKAQALTFIALLAGYDVVAVPPTGDKAFDLGTYMKAYA